MSDQHQPGTCGVCGGREWHVGYQGLIRDGVFGRTVSATIYDCNQCGVGFLPSSQGFSSGYYEGTNYRDTVGEASDAESFLKLHDAEQLGRYPLLNRVALRDRVVADVGCAAGSFLDGLRGLTSTTIGIEPSREYHDSLRQRGHLTYSDLSAASQDWQQRVHLAVSFSVIEHVPEPVAFLRQIRALLAPDGQLLISTPNRRDVLLEVGCEPYRRFFYRSVHTHYFDRDSLQMAARLAGFDQFEPRYVHRFDFANFVAWLRDSRPVGNSGPIVLGARFDRLWKTELEESGHADYLYAWLAG